MTRMLAGTTTSRRRRRRSARRGAPGRGGPATPAPGSRARARPRTRRGSAARRVRWSTTRIIAVPNASQPSACTAAGYRAVPQRPLQRTADGSSVRRCTVVTAAAHDRAMRDGFRRARGRSTAAVGHAVGACMLAVGIVVAVGGDGPDVRVQRHLAARDQHRDHRGDVPDGVRHPGRARTARRGPTQLQAGRADPRDEGRRTRADRRRGCVGRRWSSCTSALSSSCSTRQRRATPTSCDDVPVLRTGACTAAEGTARHS